MFTERELLSREREFPSAANYKLTRRKNRLAKSISSMVKHRKLGCLLLMASLLTFPNSGFGEALNWLSTFARETINDAYGPLHTLGMTIARRSRKRQQPSTLAERLALVAGIRVLPSHFVAYSGEVVSFSGVPRDSFGEVVQGSKLSWDTSDHTKMMIDEAGRATFLSPGLVWVNCRSGLAAGSVPVLIRPGTRPLQSQSDWNADQNSITDAGAATSGMAFLREAFEKISPTASAQNGGSLDFLWNYVPNWIGSPRDAAIIPSRVGPILPESNNVQASLPLIKSSGRGLTMNLALSYNSRVWFRNGSSIYYAPLPCYPAPGFYFGLGYIITYTSSFSPFDTAYLYIRPDGTPVYLGHGSATMSGLYQATDGSHILYSGNAGGGSMTLPDGTLMTMSLVNNILQVTQIQDTNGNVESFAYEDSSQGYSPLALASAMDTLGRVDTFAYDASKRLSTIMTPGQDGTNTTLWSFNYGTHNFQYTFSGLFAVNTPGNHVNLSVLSNVQKSNGNGLGFTYSDYGMAYKISVLRGGSSAASSIFNYPTSGTTSISDAPSFTSWSESPGGTSSISSSSNVGAQTLSFTLMRPDSSTLSLTRSTNTSSIANGLVTQTEIKNSDGASMNKVTFLYSNDPGGEKQVVNTVVNDDAGLATETAYQYNAAGFLTVKQEFGTSSTVQRQTNVTYVSAGGASKPAEIDVYDETVSPPKMVFKTAFSYDDYAVLGGMQDYGGAANPPGRISAYNSASITNRGNATRETDWYDIANNLSITRLAQLDIFGNDVRAQLSCCNTQSRALDQSTYWSNATSVTKGALGGPQLTTTFVYDFNTSLTTGMSDPNGVTQGYQYDQFLRPTVISLPTGATATANYGDSSMQSTTAMTYVDGGTTKTVGQTTFTDGWGNAIETLDAANNQVNSTIDAMGRLASKTNAFQHGTTPGAVTTFQYDALGRETQITLPDNTTLQKTYSGNTLTMIDQVGRKRQLQFDGLGRLASVLEQDPASGNLSQVTSYTYDIMDDLLTANVYGQIRSFAYDNLGREIYERIPEETPTIPDGAGAFWTSKFSYTDFHALATKTTANGAIIQYTYDSMNRRVGTTYDTTHAPGVVSTPSVSWNYDNANGSATQGLLLSTSVGSFYIESYGYDTVERPTSVTDTIDGKSYAIRYQYNAAGQIAQLTYPSTLQVPYAYDTAGRLCSIGGTSGNAGSPCTNGYLNSISYNPAEQVTGFALGNGVQERFSYDNTRQQLTGIQATKGSTTLMNLTYSYSALAGQFGLGASPGNTGQLTSVSGTINGVQETANYNYNLKNQLVSSNQTSNGITSALSYVWDAWGNRTSVTDTIANSQVQSVNLQQSGGVPTNRITSVTTPSSAASYQYDNDGNVTNDGVNSYSYDAEDRLISVNGGAAAQYAYNAAGKRVRKTASGSSTHYTWNSNHLLGEYNAATGAMLVEYVVDNRGVIAAITPTGTTYPLRDRLSARLNLDSNGLVLGRQGHLSFGERFAESGQQTNFHFTTYDSDPESGLNYAVNRYHNPNLGRFMTVDPLSASAVKSRPSSWNRYVYAEGEPVGRIDPSGLDDYFASNGLPSDPCNDQTLGLEFMIDGLEEPDLCMDLMQASPIIDPPPHEGCVMGFNTGIGDAPVGHYEDGPRKPSFDPNHSLIGPGTDGNYWFYFYEVIVNPINGASSADFQPQQLVFRSDATVGYIKSDGSIGYGTTPGSTDPYDNPLFFNVFHFDPGTMGWLDTPGFPMFIDPDHRKSVVSVSVTWTFVFSAIGPDGRPGCMGGFQLSFNYAIGQDLDKAWTISNVVTSSFPQ